MHISHCWSLPLLPLAPPCLLILTQLLPPRLLPGRSPLEEYYCLYVREDFDFKSERLLLLTVLLF